WGLILYEREVAKPRKQWDLHEPIAKFAKAIELDHRLVYAYNSLGSALIDAGHCNQAIPNLQRAVQLDPMYTLAYYNWGRALKCMGNTKAALAKYGQAVKIDRADEGSIRARSAIEQLKRGNR